MDDPDTEAVKAHLAGVDPAARRAEAEALDAIFRAATGFRPRLWRGDVIGYGRYHYRYASGRAGDYLATGFAVRKATLALYILPGYADFGPILDRLGPHRRGKACLYLARLDGIDRQALQDLIRAGLADLARSWPVEPA